LPKNTQHVFCFATWNKRDTSLYPVPKAFRNGSSLFTMDRPWSRAWKSSQTSHVENRMRACCLWIACCSYIGCRLAIAMKSRDKATRYLFDCIIMQTKLRYNVLDRNTSPAGYTQANVSSQFSLASKASEFSSDESIIHKSVIIYKQNIDHLFEWNKEI